MDFLKKLWPTAFLVKAKDLTAMIVQIVILIIAGAILPIVTAILGLVLGLIPVVGPLVLGILGVLSGIVGLYCLVGIVLCVLNYFEVLK